MRRILAFCGGDLTVPQSEQSRITEAGGVCYPLVRLVDMYFWQLGMGREAAESAHRLT